MVLLKPRRRLRRLPLGLHQAINVLAEGRIGQHALDLVARDRLQDDPGVMRDFPQFGIKLPPHFVGGMIPRPAHIQGQLRQGIESLDFRGQKIVDRVADAGLVCSLLGVPILAADGSSQSIADDRLGFLQDAAQMIRSPEALRIDLVDILSP